MSFVRLFHCFDQLFDEWLAKVKTKTTQFDLKFENHHEEIIMDRLLRLGGAGMGMGQNSAPTDAPVVDTAEQVYISSLALLKMLKHGRAGMIILKCKNEQRFEIINLL